MRHDPNLSRHEGKRPVSFTPCGCSRCGDYPLDIEDMAPASMFKDGWVAQLVEDNGGTVCLTCAHEAEACEWCEGPVSTEEFTASNAYAERRLCCAECMDAWATASEPVRS